MKIINSIVDKIKNIEYVDVIGTAMDGKEAYNKIIDLKPEMNGLEVIESSKEKLESDVPIFNMIIDNNIKEEEIDKAYEIIGNKLNSLIESTDEIPDSIANIINEYVEYKNNR